MFGKFNFTGFGQKYQQGSLQSELICLIIVNYKRYVSFFLYIRYIIIKMLEEFEYLKYSSIVKQALRLKLCVAVIMEGLELVCFSEVGSAKFICVLRRYKEETYCVLFELLDSLMTDGQVTVTIELLPEFIQNYVLFSNFQIMLCLHY